MLSSIASKGFTALAGPLIGHVLRDVMHQTVDKGIRALGPDAVVAVGIAFGVNKKKQAIGDILLSMQLWDYNLQRIGKDDKIVPRGDKPHASSRLINYFNGFYQTSWSGARVFPGVVLTGDKLVDNVNFRDQLIALETEAVGGEMEGSGLYVAGQEHKVDWIVIKAICDWADGNKRRKKDKNQRLAAKNAASFLIMALQHAPLKKHSDDITGHHPPALPVVGAPSPAPPLKKIAYRSTRHREVAPKTWTSG